MPYSAGNFSLYATGNPVVTATTISISWANNTLNDIASGLSTCVLKDGTQTITANVPMSGFKFTGLAAGSTAGDSLRYEQAIGVFLPLAGGTLTGNLLFTDATYDIGASGATRPRDIFQSRNHVIGGTLNVTGHTTFEGVTSTGATGTGNLVYDNTPTLITPTLGAMSATTIAGAVVATQANMETGTATNLVVTPGNQSYHLLHPKFIVKCTSLGSSPYTATAFANKQGSLTPVTNGTGDWTLSWTTALTNPSVWFNVEPDSTTLVRRIVVIRQGGLATTSVRFLCYDESGVAATPDAIYIIGFGDSA